MSKIVFSKEQREILEKEFDLIYEESRTVRSLVSILKESLIDVHGQLNSSVEAYQIEDMLNLITKSLENTYFHTLELSSDADYVFQLIEKKDKK